MLSGNTGDYTGLKPLHVVAHYQETITSDDPRCRDIVEYRDRAGNVILTVYIDRKTDWSVHSHRDADGTITRSPYAYGMPGSPAFEGESS